MDRAVTITTVDAQPIAAISERVPIGEVGSRFREPLDRVWNFVRTAGLRPHHNVFVYHHDGNDDTLVEFGVQVDLPFADGDEVVCSTTPAGTVATAMHIGPYDELFVTHAAVHAWCAAQGKEPAGLSWEVYGDWDDDPAKLETQVFYLLS